MKNELPVEVHDLRKIQKFFQVDSKGDVDQISNSCCDMHSGLNCGVGMYVQESGIKLLIYLPFHLQLQNTVEPSFEISSVGQPFIL